MKKLLGMLILLNVVAPAFAWKHWVYNYTGEKVAITPYGIANPNNAPVIIEPTSSKHEIDMGIYCTSKFKVAGVSAPTAVAQGQAASMSELAGVSFEFDHPFGEKCPGLTISIYKDTISVPQVIERADGGSIIRKKVRFKVDLEDYHGSATSVYSPERELEVPVVGPAKTVIIK